MTLHIFSKSNQANLSKLVESLKIEQKEVSDLFGLSHEEMDFDIILLLASTRALRSSLILRNYAELFYIHDAEFGSSLSKIVSAHEDFLIQAESESGKRHLTALHHFSSFSEHIQKCISIIEKLFAGKLDTSPKNNLMIRYLNNLKNGITHLKEMTLLSSLNKTKSFQN